MQPDFCDELAFAHEVVDEASVVAMRHFSAGVVATPKADGSPVTEADRAVEELIRSLIQTRYPHDGILGEEFGAIVGGSSTLSTGLPILPAMIRTGEFIWLCKLANELMLPSLLLQLWVYVGGLNGDRVPTKPFG